MAKSDSLQIYDQAKVSNFYSVYNESLKFTFTDKRVIIINVIKLKMLFI